MILKSIVKRFSKKKQKLSDLNRIQIIKNQEKRVIHHKTDQFFSQTLNKNTYHIFLLLKVYQTPLTAADVGGGGGGGEGEE